MGYYQIVDGLKWEEMERAEPKDVSRFSNIS